MKAEEYYISQTAMKNADETCISLSLNNGEE